MWDRPFKVNRNGKTAVHEIHGVCWCSNQNCRTTWNRDVNAARNMCKLFWSMVTNGLVYPDPFRHKGALTA